MLLSIAASPERPTANTYALAPSQTPTRGDRRRPIRAPTPAVNHGPASIDPPDPVVLVPPSRMVVDIHHGVVVGASGRNDSPTV